ncbi:hypothetical protein ACEV8Z_24375, partial [Vibrio parahaemolyticus]
DAGRVVWCNQVLLRDFGLARSAMVGRTAAEISMLHAGVLKRFDDVDIGSAADLIAARGVSLARADGTPHDLLDRDGRHHTLRDYR